jgi:phage baseplate assembly protein W|tara:strand:+ start:1627 stop:2055 length:429 start_codon:yes stop_codon:yes gene_type:complete
MPSYSTENLSNNSKRATRIYKDLDLDFGRNTVTNDVNKLTDVEAVKRSVRNLINTNHFERPFHPEIGGNVRALLFENMTPLTALNLQRKIEEVLSNFEPRAKITQIIADPDMDRNGYRLEIRFYVIGIQNPITVETFLERLR